MPATSSVAAGERTRVGALASVAFIRLLPGL
jgi:hypothetical protein